MSDCAACAGRFTTQPTPDKCPDCGASWKAPHFGPEWQEAVMTTWRLDEVWARLFEVRRHLEKLKFEGPERIQKDVQGILKKVKTAINRTMNVSAAESAYRRRAAGILTENEKFDQKAGRPAKPGMEKP